MKYYYTCTCCWQVALKATHKQLAATQAQLKAVQAAAAAAQQHAAALEEELAKQHSSREAAALRAAGSLLPPATAAAAAAAAAQGEADAAVRHKLAQLEGALRQASADYALILGELGKIRSEGAERQAALESAVAARARAEAEVLR